jgi:hypothetical protein
MRYGRFVGIIGLTLIIIFALAIRLFPVLNSPEKLRGGLGPFGDSFLYSLLASNLSEAKGFVTDKGKAAFTRGPGYPLFMSIIYKFFGRSGDTFAVSWDKVRIAQCILDTACCLLVFCIVWLIYPECIVFALVSAALYSLSFYNIYYTRVLLSETLTTFLVTLFILMAILSLIRKQIRWFFYSGVSLGFIVLW